MRRIAFVVAATSLLAGSSGGDIQARPAAGAIDGNLSLADAKRFQPFALYYLGMEFDGFALRSINRRLDPLRNRTAIGGRRNFVTFWYGDCVPPCGAPLELQIWSACDRSYAFYTRGITQDGRVIRVPPLGHETLRVRGVPATLWEAGTRLELYTGRVTVVIFTNTRERVFRAAEALRGLNVSVAAGADLPSPRPGHLTAKLKCRT